MAKKIREQIISLISYLTKVKEDDISDSQDVQRLFCWDNNEINQLIVTVLTDDYIPPIILGEEEIGDGMVRQYIIDGMQRSSALIKFRYGNYKIGSSVEDSTVQYQKKKRDGNGKVCKDADGNVVWDCDEFDIKGKTFDSLPEELKKRFDDYQIRIAVHQNCTMEQISKLVRRYNNHKAMNASQKAFTYVDNYARKIRTISQCGFFKNCTGYSETERKKGTYEKLVCESVMAIFHLDKWKKQPKQMNIFLNENSSEEEFDKVLDYANRLELICEDRFHDLFTLKNISVWFAVFHKFTGLGVEDTRFSDFMEALKEELHSKKVNDLTYDMVNRESGTKDKKVIMTKIQLLETLVLEYLQADREQTTAFDFVKENVSEDITEEDLLFYEEVLDDLTLEVDNNSKLLEDRNLNSLLAMVAYSFLKDIDLDRWLPDFFKRNSTYKKDQKENYNYMVKDLTKFLHKGAVA